MIITKLDILSYYENCGKLENESIRSQIIDMKRSQVEKIHKNSISQSKDGWWRTTVPDPTKKSGRWTIAKHTKEEVLDVLCDYYDGKQYSLKDAFVDYENHRRELGNSENTVARDWNDWNKLCESDPDHFASLPVREIEYSQLDDWIVRTLKRYKGQKGRRGSALSYRSFSQGLKMLQRVFSRCYCQGKLDKNPRDLFDMIDLSEYKHLFTESNHRTEAVRFLDEVQFHRLQSGLEKKHKEKPGYIPGYVVDVALGSGCRSGELAALRWDHLDLETGEALIDCSVKRIQSEHREVDGETKTGKHREIALTPACVNALKTIQAVQREHGWTSEWVFADERGRIPKSTLECAANNWMAECGCQATGLQVCRRSFNQRMKDHSVDETTRCAQLGHTAEVNGRYYSRVESSLAKKHAAVSNL